MRKKDDIQELLRDKLQSHEVVPSDTVWKNISSSLANTAVTSGAAASGTSLLLKVAAVVAGVSSIGVAAYFILNGNEGFEKKGIQTIMAPKAEGIDSENFDESNVTITPIESRVKSILSEDNSSSEELNRTEPINSPTSEGRVMFNEDIDNLPKIDEDKMIPTASILESSSEAAVKENTVVIPPLPVSDAVVLSDAPVEKDEEKLLGNPDTQNQVDEAQNSMDVLEAIVLPNIFTPNNDGVNDFFEIQMSEKLEFQIVVIDQANKVIFQSNQVDFSWDGTFPGGEPVPPGNYIYYLTAKTLNGKDFVKHSDLRIER